MGLERTLVIVKPDGVQRGLVGPILTRLEARGLKVVGLKLVQVSQELAARHYAEHEGKPFYPGLLKYITSAPVVDTHLADAVKTRLKALLGVGVKRG